MSTQPLGDPSALREDLGREYYALLDVVSGYDGRLLIVKGWSVTLSLAGLGLGFQQGHYALFGLAALSGGAFWYLDALFKGHQMRSYSRMRDIEVAAYQLNGVPLDGLGTVSAPRIDMSWGFTGDPGGGDPRTAVPERRSAAEVRTMLRRRGTAVRDAVGRPAVVPAASRPTARTGSLRR